MKTHNIKTDYLDIIFENRNKEYGAYELRRAYDRRMTIAVSITFGIGMVILFSSFIFQNDLHETKPRIQVVELMGDIILPEKEKKIEPEPAKPVAKQTFKTEDFVTTRVVPNEDVKPDDMPPSIDSLAGAMIGTEKNAGAMDDGTQHSAGSPTGNGRSSEPETIVEEKPFVKVEIEAEFPGGNQAWSKYVSREVERNIDALQDDGHSGTVVVLFIVDRDGNVSDVRALDCLEAAVPNCLGKDAMLAQVAVKAIKKGPNWKPAIQNGKAVKAYRRQAVTFRLAD